MQVFMLTLLILPVCRNDFEYPGTASWVRLSILPGFFFGLNFGDHGFAAQVLGVGIELSLMLLAGLIFHLLLLIHAAGRV